MNRIKDHMQPLQPAPRPRHSTWENSAPEGERQAWAWQRRVELANFAALALARSDAGLLGGVETPEERAAEAVKVALALQAAVDAARPRP